MNLKVSTAQLENCEFKQYFEPPLDVNGRVKRGDDGKVIKPAVKEGIQKIAEHLIKKYYVKTIGEEQKTKRIYIYDNGIYILGESILRKEIENILDKVANIHYKNEIIIKIKDNTPVCLKDFNTNPNYLFFNNCIYDIKNNKRIEFTPDILSFTKITTDYDNMAECPEIVKFMNRIMDDKVKTIMQEFFGFCLYRRYFIKKAIIMTGPADTGKTTLMNLLNMFIGSDNDSGLSLQKISTGNQFSKVPLYGALINSFDDLSTNNLIDNEGFKMATGKSRITAEYKFGDQFKFFSYAKLIFTCNQIPVVQEISDDAFFNRWIILKFDKVIPENEIDGNIEDKLYSKNELSGLLNWSLIGLKRLLNENNFSYFLGVKEIREEMMKNADSIASFAYTCIELIDDYFTSTEDIYEAYEKYTNENDKPTETKDMVSKRLPKYLRGILHKERNVGGINKNGFLHCRLKKEWEKYPDYAPCKE